MKHLVLYLICFSCLHDFFAQEQPAGTFTDVRDGRVYKIVIIGDQTWMAENLAYLPAVFPAGDSRFEGVRFYVYGYQGDDLSEALEESNYKRYGALYNWDAARQSCPAGWHLPTDNEWKTLEKRLGMAEDADDMGWRSTGEAGSKLMSASGWKGEGGRDETGFHALPAGCRGYDGFESMGYCTYFWTASPAGGDNGWRRGLCGDDKGIARDQDRRYFGISVRCLKD